MNNPTMAFINAFILVKLKQQLRQNQIAHDGQARCRQDSTCQWLGDGLTNPWSLEYLQPNTNVKKLYSRLCLARNVYCYRPRLNSGQSA